MIYKDLGCAQGDLWLSDVHGQKGFGWIAVLVTQLFA